MRHRVGMALVDLDERDEHDEPDDAPERPQEQRRLSRRWLLVPAVVVAALVGTQLVVEVRDRAAAAALAQVPGVVRPVDRDLEVLWTQDPRGSELWPGLPD